VKRTLKLLGGLVLVLLLIGSLTACDEDDTLAVPQSFCGFIQGKGGRDRDENANNANLDRVLYAGQTADYRTDKQIARVFPCVSRNYRIASGGDSDQPLRALTKTGVPVKLWVSMYWQPNQQPDPLKEFIGFCQGKYGCAGGSPSDFTQTDQNRNASTPGWNKMLAENWHDVLQRISEAPVKNAEDSVWQINDPAQRDTVAKAMSAAFAGEFQKVTGSTKDLICGGGSTGVGEQFDCKQVYVVVDLVQAENDQQQQATTQAVADAAQRKLDEDQLQADMNLTNTKYGPLAPAYRACRDLNAKQPGACKFITGPGGAQVPVP